VTQGAYKEKQILYRNLVLIILLPLVGDVEAAGSFLVQCTCTVPQGKKRLDASFLVACASFKQTPPFLTLKAETSRLKFKELDLIK
jgi:hypothetical protein